MQSVTPPQHSILQHMYFYIADNYDIDVLESHKQGNGPSDSIKDKKFLDYLSNDQLLKKDSPQWDYPFD
jgi:hypothetical protein